MNINDLFEMGPIGSELELSTAVLAFPPFERVLIGKKDRTLAIKEIKYILWLHMWNSPYNVVSPEKREEMIKRDIFGDTKYELSREAQEAEREYVEIYQTSEILEMLKSARKGIWYTNKAFDALSLSNMDTDPGKVQDWTKKLGDMYKSLDTLEKAVKSQVDLGTKVRGGNAINPYEVPRSSAS